MHDKRLIYAPKMTIKNLEFLDFYMGNKEDLIF
jgi:hypothetical protein